MLDEDDLWPMEELPIDEPTELLETMPELWRCLAHGQREEEAGFRSILERPEALSRAWWRHGISKRRRAIVNGRGSAALRAA